MNASALLSVWASGTEYKRSERVTVQHMWHCYKGVGTTDTSDRIKLASGFRLMFFAIRKLKSHRKSVPKSRPQNSLFIQKIYIQTILIRHTLHVYFSFEWKLAKNGGNALSFNPFVIFLHGEESCSCGSGNYVPVCAVVFGPWINRMTLDGLQSKRPNQTSRVSHGDPYTLHG